MITKLYDTCFIDIINYNFVLIFKAPQDPLGWDGILNCTKNTKQCIQSGPLSKIFNNGLDDDFGTEDCLYLNVYTPLVSETLRSAYFLFGIS